MSIAPTKIYIIYFVEECLNSKDKGGVKSRFKPNKEILFGCTAVNYGVIKSCQLSMAGYDAMMH